MAQAPAIAPPLQNRDFPPFQRRQKPRCICRGQMPPETPPQALRALGCMAGQQGTGLRTRRRHEQMPPGRGRGSTVATARCAPRIWPARRTPRAMLAASSHRCGSAPAGLVRHLRSNAHCDGGGIAAEVRRRVPLARCRKACDRCRRRPSRRSRLRHRARAARPVQACDSRCPAHHATSTPPGSRSGGTSAFRARQAQRGRFRFCCAAPSLAPSTSAHTHSSESQSRTNITCGLEERGRRWPRCRRCGTQAPARSLRHDPPQCDDMRILVCKWRLRALTKRRARSSRSGPSYSLRRPPHRTDRASRACPPARLGRGTEFADQGPAMLRDHANLLRARTPVSCAIGFASST